MLKQILDWAVLLMAAAVFYVCIAAGIHVDSGELTPPQVNWQNAYEATPQQFEAMWLQRQRQKAEQHLQEFRREQAKKAKRPQFFGDAWLLEMPSQLQRQIASYH